MSHTLEEMNLSKPLKDRLITAGIEAAVGASDAPASGSMLSNFSSLYNYLSKEGLNVGRLKAIFGGGNDLGDKLGNLSSPQKDLIKHIDKKTFIASGSFLMHEIDGLVVDIPTFAEMLMSFSVFPERVIKSLDQLNDLAFDATDNREVLAAASTISRLGTIDCQLKLRAQFNAELKKMIKEVKVNSKGRPIGDAFSNVSQIENCLSLRNRISHEIKPEQTGRIVRLVQMLDDKLAVISEQVNEENHLKPNARVMTAFSKLLYESAEMVQELGIWYHYVNKFVVVMDKLVEDRKKI